MYSDQLQSTNHSVQNEKKLKHIGTLSGFLIHELRNPLHHIANFSYVISETEELSDEGKELFAYIDGAEKHLENIVDSFQNYIRTGKFEKAEDDLNEVIEHAMELTKENVMGHHVDLNFNRKDERIVVPMNKDFMIQVFVNLIKNCAEAIPEEREVRSITIDINVRKYVVEVDICDSGKGIPDENWDKIFAPFVSNKKSGMGMGLAFCKKIMLEHLGDLKIIDSNSNGTRFQITLPRY